MQQRVPALDATPPLLQQLQQLQLSGPASCSGNAHYIHARLRESSRTSSSEECCCSSSSSSDMSPAALQQHVHLQDVASSSVADESHQGDDSGEPLLQDNPDRFTLSPIQ